jgi:predicted DNA-binding mobile mystery protein A
MSVAKTRLKLSRRLIDNARTSTEKLSNPVGGWIKTFQESLGISTVTLAARLGVTRNSVYKAIENEKSGGISLGQLNKMAEAMGGKLVYAIVPVEGSVEDAVLKQARKKSGKLVTRTWAHMTMEDQTEGLETKEDRIERMAQEMASDMPRDLWN